MGMWISAKVGFGFVIPNTGEDDEFDFKDAWRILGLPETVMYGDMEVKASEDKTDLYEFEKALQTKFPNLTVVESNVYDYRQGMAVLVKSTVIWTDEGLTMLNFPVDKPNLSESVELAEASMAFGIEASSEMFGQVLVVSYR